MTDTSWFFEVDSEELITLSAVPEIPENTVLALETLILPFGLSRQSASTYLREWRRMAREFGEGYVLGTPAASVERVDEGHVKIDDMYGQFDDCCINNGDFEEFLEGFIDYLAGIEVD
ncbi:hypothetical protein ACL02U_30455 [Streptomyces sp. MS06]|uniref:hypothetical protein n=1 Tax=Streptomyces sp. MS06 TaxID=3385974 RepID=UPI0039A10FB3